MGGWQSGEYDPGRQRPATPPQWQRREDADGPRFTPQPQPESRAGYGDPWQQPPTRTASKDPWQESQAGPVDSDPRPPHEPRRYQPPRKRAPQDQAPQHQPPRYQAPQRRPPQFQATHHRIPLSQPQPPRRPQEQPPRYQPPPYQAPRYQAPRYQAPRYQPQPYQPPFSPPRGKSWVGQHKVVTGFLALCGLVFVIAVGSALGSSSTTSLTPSAAQTQGVVPALPAATAAAAAAKKQTVSYVVTGSAADVSYGPAGSDFAGTVPLQITQPLGTPIYYSINAQLQGGGTVSCAIEVDGKAISSATASGGYNIASCEITQDPFSGDWTDTNDG